MGVLRPIVLPALGDLPIFSPDLLESCAVGAQLVSHDFLGPAKPLHQLAQESQGSLLVPRLGYEGFQHLAFVVHSPPKVVLHAVDADEHLAEVQSPARLAHLSTMPFAVLGFEPGPDLLLEKPDHPVADLDPMLV